MEVYFTKKRTSHTRKSPNLLLTTCIIKTFPELCKCRIVSHLCICFDKNTVLVQYNAFAGDFTSVVLIRMLPGALNTFVLPVTACFVLLCGTYSSAKLDSLENN